MNEQAKAWYDIAGQYLTNAEDSEDVNTALVYTNQAQVALGLAWFAVQNPCTVAGLDLIPDPPGADPSGTLSPSPAGPVSGPRLWGPPQ